VRRLRRHLLRRLVLRRRSRERERFYAENRRPSHR
jgi:hypothetical protein